MAPRVFITQEALDTWVSRDQVEISEDVLVFRAGRVSLRLAPASYFGKVSAGSDTHQLVGRVKEDAALAALGAETYMTSVLLGETAYEVEPGFLGTPVGPQDAGPALVSALRSAGS